MNLATIDVSPAEAEAKLKEYSRVVAAQRSTEDQALAQAYRAVRRGLTVIRLSEAVHAGGYFDSGLPRIAVVRADATECWVDVDGWWRSAPNTRYVFAGERRAANRGALVGANTVRVTTPGPDVRPDPKDKARYGGRTTVPLIPPKVRPRRPRLASCHILWEVEAWDPTPPRDPALLRHLRGDLWAVLACWDLTELERAVLSQRVAR